MPCRQKQLLLRIFSHSIMREYKQGGTATVCYAVGNKSADFIYIRESFVTHCKIFFFCKAAT